VNLELALRADARLGGHIMQGHVDGLGTVREIREDGFARWITIAAPAGAPALRRGEGVDRRGRDLPHRRRRRRGVLQRLAHPETLARTTLGEARPGAPVNLEVDVMAKYAEKLLAGRLA
jgi:riboflavin synthase